jgi:hypothetical protein
MAEVVPQNLGKTGHRPLWAYVTDKIMSIKALGDAKNVDVALRMCLYLQKWRPKMADLSEDLARMVKVGEKYGLVN